MQNIGAQSIVNQHTTSVTNQRRQTLNQEQALKKDIGAAQQNNASTIGRSVNRQEDDSKKTDSLNQKETFVPSTALPETEQAELQAEVQSAPATEAEQESIEDKQEARPLASEQKFHDFIEVFSGQTDQEEMTSIMTDAAVQMNERGITDESQQGGFLAATALNHSLSQIQKKMPGATKEQIKEEAKTDPEIAKWSNIADSAAGYLNQVKAENAQGGGVPGASVPGASPTGVGQGPNGGVNDPFAATAGVPRADGVEGGASASPPLGPKELAEQMAENQRTMEQIRTIYNQMWAEMLKAQAERHKLMMDTMTAIREMYSSSHVYRMQSMAKHNASVTAAITGNPAPR